MNTINTTEAAKLTKELMSDKSISKWEASNYVLNKYDVVWDGSPGRKIMSPQAILSRLDRDGTVPMKKRKSKNIEIKIRTRNMAAYNVKKDIRTVLDMNVSDTLKLKIISEFIR
jgi:hypothetical protein